MTDTLITPEWLREMGACYSDERIEAEWRRLRWPRKGVPLLRLMRARSLDPADRVWVATSTPGDWEWFADACVDRAVAHAICALDAAGVEHTLDRDGRRTPQELVAAATAAAARHAYTAHAAAHAAANAATSATANAAANAYDAACYAAHAAAHAAAARHAFYVAYVAGRAAERAIQVRCIIHHPSTKALGSFQPEDGGAVP